LRVDRLSADEPGRKLKLKGDVCMKTNQTTNTSKKGANKKEQEVKPVETVEENKAEEVKPVVTTEENKAEEVKSADTTEVKTEQATTEAAKAAESAMALEVASILARTDISETERWMLLMKAAETKVDESKIEDLSLLSEAEIQRRIKNIASKKTAARKKNDVLLLTKLEGEEEALKAVRQKPTRSRAGAISSDVDPTTLSQEDLRKLIRNVQSKKCSAKKAGDEAKVAEYAKEEERLSALRKPIEGGTTAGSAMSVKINQTIAELEKLEQTEMVKTQIAMLKSLL
jgi:hypothetical protein